MSSDALASLDKEFSCISNKIKDINQITGKRNCKELLVLPFELLSQPALIVVNYVRKNRMKNVGTTGMPLFDLNHQEDIVGLQPYIISHKGYVPTVQYCVLNMSTRFHFTTDTLFKRDGLVLSRKN